jgi:putative phage-type endonuclease
MKIVRVKQRTPEWHEYRSRRITGSTAAAILGASKYGTPLTEWLRLTGRRAPERVEAPWMTWGTLTEPVNAELYRRRHPERELVQEEHMVEHPEFSWLAFSPDGFWMDRGTGQKGLWEAKAPSPFNDEWKKRIPLDNAIQCQIGMACTGDSHASVSALIWPGVLTFELERDQRFLDVAIPKLVEFMEYNVKRDVMPAATASEADTEALEAIGDSASAVTYTPEIADLFAKLEQLNAAAKAADTRVCAVKNRLVQLTGRKMWNEAKAAIQAARKVAV